MADTTRELALACVRAMLKPIVRFCLKRSLHIQDLLESAKVVFIELAERDIEDSGEKVSGCRLSATTGIHRRDISRIWQKKEIKEQPQSLMQRVLGHWQQDTRYSTKSGKPRVLEEAEFRELVSGISNDVTPGTVLYELERVGAVQRTRGGLKLTSRVYVPKGNLQEGFALIARDAQHLMAAVEENLFEPEPTPNLHLNTQFDRISDEDIPEIREWLIREGSALHQKARNYLSKFDADLNAKLDPEECNSKVKLACFSLTSEKGSL